MNLSKNWIADYYELHKAGRLAEALALKEVNLPKSLYRYRSLNNAYDIENIRAGQFFLSPPCEMNDPYESDFVLDGDYMRNETYRNGDIFKFVNFRNYLSEEQIFLLQVSDNPNELFVEFLMEKFPNDKDKLPKLNQVMRQLAHKVGDDLNYWFAEFIKDGIKFCSFSTRNDSTLMWSHYANRHTGICVEYDFTDYHLKNSLYPVVYDDIMMDVTSLVMDKSLNYLIPIFAITQKAKDWQYEKEWRLVMTHGILKNSNLVYSPPPVRVFLGINTAEVNKSKIRELGDQMGFEIIQMKKIPHSFKITN